MNAQLVLIILSIIATVFSGITAASAKGGLEEVAVKVGEGIVRLISKRIEAPPRDGVSVRLREVRSALKRQQRIATTFSTVSSTLTFVQFVVGGLLTTSFLQESLSKPVIGVLGLLVLGSSWIRQYYRPDVQALGARTRAAKLRALIRKLEDQIAMTEEGFSNTLSRPEMLRMLSDGLNQIEEEIQEISNLNQTVESTENKRLKKPQNDESATDKIS